MTDDETTKEVKRVMTPEWAEVHVEFTRNLGNFENIKYRIGYGSPRGNDETPNEAVERVAEFVEESLLAKVQKLTDELNA